MVTPPFFLSLFLNCEMFCFPPFFLVPSPHPHPFYLVSPCWWSQSPELVGRRDFTVYGFDPSFSLPLHDCLKAQDDPPGLPIFFSFKEVPIGVFLLEFILVDSPSPSLSFSSPIAILRFNESLAPSYFREQRTRSARRLFWLWNPVPTVSRSLALTGARFLPPTRRPEEPLFQSVFLKRYPSLKDIRVPPNGLGSPQQRMPSLCRLPPPPASLESSV